MKLIALPYVFALALLIACDRQGQAVEPPIVVDSLARAILEPATAEERGLDYSVLTGYTLRPAAVIKAPLLIESDAELRHYLVPTAQASAVDFANQLLLLIVKPPTQIATTLRVQQLQFDGTTLRLNYTMALGTRQDTMQRPLLLISTARPTADSLPQLYVTEQLDTLGLSATPTE